jgi:hypothetical protein
MEDNLQQKLNLETQTKHIKSKKFKIIEIRKQKNKRIDNIKSLVG